MMKRLPLLGLVALLLASCATTNPTSTFALIAVSNGHETDVENIENKTITHTLTRKQYANEVYMTEVVEEITHNKVTHEYTCDDFHIVWDISPTRLNFDILNASGSSIRIVWQDVTMVDFNDYVYRVYHEYMRYADKQAFTPDMVIPDGARYKDFLLPFRQAVWTGSDYKELPLVAPHEARVGNTMKVVIPMEVDGRRMEYAFTFEITDVQ